MGLQIVQDRVDALDGTLEVTSDLGRGTRVAVRLPIRALEPVR
jgi:signal transduction histidine kinase